MIGQTLSHYRITRKLGSGGMGVVYLATDLRLDRDVALKFLPEEMTHAEGLRERLEVEARAASALDHPNICTIHDIEQTDEGRLYIVMAFYDGETLHARLERGALPVEEALDIARRIALGLERAHQSGVVHRDIKPANVMVTDRGEVKILDFGIAKMQEQSGLTRTGESLGTPAYMAPEQIDGAEITLQTDLWSLGCLLYQLISGTQPFTRSSHQATVGAILGAEPDPLEVEVPDGVAALVRQLLAKSPTDRPASAHEVADRLEAILDEMRPRERTAFVTPGRGAAVAVAALAVAFFAVILPARRRARLDEARALLPQVESLASTGDYAAAYDLAIRAEATLGGDPALTALMDRVSDRISVHSDPPGAEVLLRLFDPSTSVSAEELAEDPGRALGMTPIDSIRIPRVDALVTVARDGYLPRQRILSSLLQRLDGVYRTDSVLTFAPILRPEGSVPPGMVPVPGGSYQLQGPDVPLNRTSELEDYGIGRFEVTNEEYLAFVRAGGYSDPSLWLHPFIKDGQEIPWDQAMGLFRDRTGLPGPRDWSGQTFPEGRARHPVAGVSWYEAEAYGASVGQRLPTLVEWRKAVRNGVVFHTSGTMTPWGAAGPGSTTAERANFSSAGTVPVGRYAFGISPWGVYDMAGNVKEWTYNRSGSERLVTGGSWEDPVHLHTEVGSQDPWSASESLGFRLAVGMSDRGLDVMLHDDEQGSAEIDLDRVTPSYTPVDEAGYRALLTHYRYDRVPMEAHVTATDETDDWRRERITLGRTGTDEVLLAYLYLPRSSRPQYQTIVFIPSGSAFFEPVPKLAEYVWAPHIRGGRAVLALVLEGMTEREVAPGEVLPIQLPSNSVAFRDQMVRHATEVRVWMDYLESRDDVDVNGRVYSGFSFGVGSRAVLAGVDDRFKAFVLVGAGIDERVQPTLPEASNINFIPYIRGPKLVINGRQDEEHPWLTRGLPFWRLLSEPKELRLIQGAGHLPPAEARVPAIEEFLDRTLGPVRRR
jgi:eukaryotic-like serine/threonine-protein kinase